MSGFDPVSVYTSNGKGLDRQTLSIEQKRSRKRIPQHIGRGASIYQALGDAATFFTFPVAAKDAADAIAGNIATLASAGAKRFMWLNLPPLGEVPYISSNSNWFIRDLGREAGDRRRADLQQ